MLWSESLAATFACTWQNIFPFPSGSRIGSLPQRHVFEHALDARYSVHNLSERTILPLISIVGSNFQYVYYYSQGDARHKEGAQRTLRHVRDIELWNR